MRLTMHKVYLVPAHGTTIQKVPWGYIVRDHLTGALLGTRSTKPAALKLAARQASRDNLAH